MTLCLELFHKITEMCDFFELDKKIILSLSEQSIKELDTIMVSPGGFSKTKDGDCVFKIDGYTFIIVEGSSNKYQPNDQ